MKRVLLLVVLTFATIGCASVPPYVYVPNSNSAEIKTGIDINFIAYTKTNMLDDMLFIKSQYRDFRIDGGMAGSCWGRSAHTQFIPVTPGKHKFSLCTYERGFLTLGFKRNKGCSDHAFSVAEGQTARVTIDDELAMAWFEKVIFSEEL